ncbi:cobalamin B12-binding domain-containing protein [Streptomyces lydicus]
MGKAMERACDDARHSGVVIVSSLASDAHTWNLVYLQLLLEEHGFEVVNLGACVPDELLVAECLDRAPDMLVISSVNGHGYQDGLRVIAQLRRRPALARTRMVIGGKLGISGARDGLRADRLLAAGFDAVFPDGPDAVPEFERYLSHVFERVAS